MTEDVPGIFTMKPLVLVCLLKVGERTENISEAGELPVVTLILTNLSASPQSTRKTEHLGV